ncbi:MAG: hypothetical protein CM1200mP14_02200 [Gammaproteobacteria bacterium]|nr:MAG: hypothetical protein CM1200mP14_02200 [Gammaproteobacteria bacterium]
MTIKIDIGAPGESYPALIGAGLLEQLPHILDEYAPSYRYAVISDDQVGPLYARALVERCRSSGKKAELYSFPPVKSRKAGRIGPSLLRSPRRWVWT